MPPPDRNSSRPVANKFVLIGGGFALLAIAVVAYGLGSRQAHQNRGDVSSVSNRSRLRHEPFVCLDELHKFAGCP